MPCIIVKTNVKINKKKGEELKKAFAQSWTKIPTKRERWLMIDFQDKQHMYFGGKDTPMAFVNFKIHGSLGEEYCNLMSDELMEDLSQHLGIQKGRIFVSHDECPYWGYLDDEI